MRDKLRCPKCDHDQILYLPRVSDQRGDLVPTRFSLHAETFMGHPSRTSVYGQLEAYVCTKCGFTEFYALQPDRIPFNEIPGAKLLTGSGGPYR